MNYESQLKRTITNLIREGGCTTQEIGEIVADILNEEEKKTKKKEEAATLAQMYNEFLEKYYPDIEANISGEILIVTLDAMEEMPPFNAGNNRLSF